ncbi:hypothetical protein D2Q93_05530 [Alicyclobacillaceae bacterium I2511]|nr:hypothetical protein D2Q93_05530 [Alicyclobacillaceae bacterium I2511]
MRRWKRRLQQAATDLLSLPRDTMMSGVSRLTCVDGEQVIVENITGLLHVSDSRVEVGLQDRQLTLSGQNFVVTLVSVGEVHVHGNVQQILYQTKGGVS